MMEHYDRDSLVKYDSEDIPGTTRMVHPAWRDLDKQIKRLKVRRRSTKRRVAVQDLPEEERPRQLLPLAKTLTDTVKMITYRAETTLVGLLRKHLTNEVEARALIREVFLSSADLDPDNIAGTLTISIHRMASPVHDRAINQLV